MLDLPTKRFTYWTISLACYHHLGFAFKDWIVNKERSIRFPPPCLNHNSSGGYTMAGKSRRAYNQIMTFTATEQVQIQVTLNIQQQQQKASSCSGAPGNSSGIHTDTQNTTPVRHLRYYSSQRRAWERGIRGTCGTPGLSRGDRRGRTLPWRKEVPPGTACQTKGRCEDQWPPEGSTRTQSLHFNGWTQAENSEFKSWSDCFNKLHFCCKNSYFPLYIRFPITLRHSDTGKSVFCFLAVGMLA